MFIANKKVMEKIAKWNTTLPGYTFADSFCVSRLMPGMTVTFFKYGRIKVDYANPKTGFEYHDKWDYTNYKDFLADARKFSK